MDGGIQEGGRRPGTEDVPAIVGLGKAELAESILMKDIRLTDLRDMLIKRCIKQYRAFITYRTSGTAFAGICAASV